MKILRWTGLTFLALIALFAGLVYFGAQPYLNKHLSTLFKEKTGGLYNFSFDKIELNFRQKGFQITNIQLTHDQKIAKTIQSTHPNKVFYAFSSPSIRVDNLDFSSLVFSKEIWIKTITISNPRLQLTGPELFGSDSTQVFKYALNEIRPVFGRFAHSFEVDEVEFVDANYQLFNLIGDTTRVSKADKVSIGISHFRTDTTLLKNPSQPFDSDDIFVRILGFRHEMSDSLHFLEIDSMEYSLKNTELKAYRSSLEPTAKTGGKSLYEVEIPRLLMRSRNLSGLKFNDSLDISYLELDDPKIVFTQKNNPKKLRIQDIDNFNLYDLVRNEFALIKVDSFYLNNARLKIFKNVTDKNYQQLFSNINIGLLGFELDSASRKNKNKLLYADEIEMRIKGYELNLDDDFHRFVSDSIYVSTINDSLSISAIKINPTKPTGSWAPVILRIDCKNINFGGVDLKEVYHRRIVPGSLVEIVQPKVTVDNYPEFKGRKDEPGVLFSLVSAYLKGVYSKKINIRNGFLKFTNFESTKPADEYEVKFSFSLTDFSLDSVSRQRTDKFFYATNFDLQFSDYQMHIARDIHKLSVKNIHVSNSASEIKIDSLHFCPVSPDMGEAGLKESERSELYDILIPEIILRNTNIHKAFFDSDLDIDNFTITNPKIVFENFASLKTKKGQKDFNELYKLIFRYVNDISIHTLTVPSGKIRLVNHSKKKKTISLDNTFSTTLFNFRLNPDEIGKYKLLFSENLQFTLNDQVFQMADSVHYFKAGQINISTKNNEIEIKDALLYPEPSAPGYKSKNATINLSAPSLLFKGIDIAEAWYTRKIDVGEILFSNPKLEVYSQSRQVKNLDLKKFTVPLPQFIESMQVGKINLVSGLVATYFTDGSIRRQSSRFGIDLISEKLSLIKTKNQQPDLIKSENISARLTDFQLNFNDQSHTAKVDELRFDKKQQVIAIRNFKLVPTGTQSIKNRINVEVPVATLSGFDLDKAYESNQYSFSSIKFDSPTVNIELADSAKGNSLKRFSELNLYNYLEPYFSSLNVGEFMLTNAGLNIESPKTKFHQKDFQIRFKNIVIDEKTKKPDILNSDGFEILAFNYSNIFADDQYKLKIDSMKYSSFTNTAELQNISIKPIVEFDKIKKKSGFQTDIVELETESVVLTGFDYDDWISEKIIRGNILKIGPSALKIHRDNTYPFNKNQKPPWPQELLQKLEQPFEIDSLVIVPSGISYIETLSKNKQEMEVRFDEFSATGGEISNIQKRGFPIQPFTLKTKAIIAGKGVVQMDIDFYLNNPLFKHRVSGSIEPLEMKIFNPILEKSTNMAIEQGQLNRFDFDFIADENNVTGQLYFGYDDFKIGVNNIRNGDTIRSGLGSFLANSLVIDSKNPRGKTFEPEKINYQRNPHRSILNYWWKAVFGSVKSVVGIDEKQQKRGNSGEDGSE